MFQQRESACGVKLMTTFETKTFIKYHKMLNTDLHMVNETRVNIKLLIILSRKTNTSWHHNTILI